MDPTIESLDNEEIQVEFSLRPQSFAEIIGRSREKSTLEMMISSAKSQSEPLDHILFHGPPGLGKTSFAQVVAKEMGAPIHMTSGPAITKQGDLAAILTGLESGAILFIDEIHRLNKVVEEILYPAMEDRALDIVMGKGNGAKTLRIDLEPITIIGATTRVGLISKPLLDRFGADFRLDYYSLPEMQQIVLQKARVLKIGIDPTAANIIGERSRRTPRVAVRILKRVRDYVLSKQLAKIGEEEVLRTLEMLDIDRAGLDYLDKKILLTLIDNFRGGPVGLNSLAAAISEEIDTLSDVYEPYLLQEGFLERGPRGRRATAKSYQHFDRPYIVTENLL